MAGRLSFAVAVGAGLGGLWVLAAIASSRPPTAPRRGGIARAEPRTAARPGRPLQGPPSMVPVPAGPFVMGHHYGQVDEKPPRRVRLAAFEIDRTEVSRGQWKRCVRAGVCPRLPKGPGDAYPATGMSWFGAERYCRWRGARLPTEAQWEKAARGPDGRRFPWGDALVPGVAACGRGCGPGAGRLHPVDGPLARRGASPYGAVHMAGNVEEWVADRYGEGYTRAGPAVDPPGPATGVYRVVRGGEYSQPIEVVRSSNRYWARPGQGSDRRGFRCAR